MVVTQPSWLSMYMYRYISIENYTFKGSYTYTCSYVCTTVAIELKSTCEKLIKMAI